MAQPPRCCPLVARWGDSEALLFVCVVVGLELKPHMSKTSVRPLSCSPCPLVLPIACSRTLSWSPRALAARLSHPGHLAQWPSPTSLPALSLPLVLSFSCQPRK